MQNKLRQIFPCLILAGFLLTAGTVLGQTKPKNRRQSKRAVAIQRAPLWEYKVTGSISIEEMNRLGAAGWELAAATAYTDNTALYFKRRKR